jgi:uncharacterized protein (TIGR02145 family)/uncharacterized repeat protein (TIGR02543 family)
MIGRNAWILIVSAVIVPLVLSCNNSPNPFSASDASISLRLVNSSDQREDHSISDTVGKTIRVGVSGYLIQYITSVSVLVGRSPTDTDTSFTFGSFSSSTDTLWLDIVFKSAGSRKVTAIASIQGASPYTDTATIVVIALPVQTYGVSYDGNGNTSGSVPVDANSFQQGAGVTVKANTGSLVKTGFTFAGWNTAADGSGTSYAGGESFLMTAGNVTLYAKWTQNPTYGVTYSGNNNTSGTVPADANAYLQGATVTVLANSGSLARTGYTFAGWNTAADGSGTSYAGGETFAIASANVTLYAVWTQNPTYTVTYSGNNNSSGTAPTDANAYQQGANVTAKANTGNLARTGYTFAGWNTAADGSGTSYAAGTAFNIGTANVTLYAVWTQNPTYAVTYSGNNNTSGAAPTDANAYEQGASVNVKANTGNLVRTGYTFAGWNAAADGSGTTYATGATLTMGSTNVTLYAVWTQNPTYTVTYSGNNNSSGTAPTDANAYQQGASVTVKTNSGNLARTSYTFAGWNAAADGSGTTYATGATLTMGSANVTLYAVWTQSPTYTVTYSGNNNTSGTAPTDANAYQQGASVTIKTNSGNLARTGYTFASWNTAADGSGTTYATGANLAMPGANITLYAVWTQNVTYTVTYNANGGDASQVPVDANAYQQGATVTVKAAGSLTRTGYSFAGWNTAADGTGTSYNAAATFLMGAANVTLYAKWSLIPTYTVTYNANGGDVTTIPIDANTYAQSATVTVKAPGGLTRTGYNFNGWNTAADGTGTSYASAATFAMGNANVVLYAKWTIKQDTVTFNSNGGSTVAAQAIAYGGTATSPAAPTQAGFIFAGWYADQALTTAFLFTTPITASITLYAKWTPVYTVTYNANNSTTGTVPMDTNKYTNGVTVSVLDNTGNLARTGYTFSGWNTNAAGTGADRPVGSTFAIGNANVVLYAKWTANSYIVNFDGQSATTAPYPTSITVTTPATTVGTLPSAPLKTSYVFDGWWTGTKGAGTAFTATTPVTQNITVYAKWSIKDADGNVYTEVTIGTQVWMVQNLKTTKYRDGTAIISVQDSASWVNNSGTAIFCWYKNDSASYKNPYGAIYNWYAVNTGKLAPSGWHVPTVAEWVELQNYLGTNVQTVSNDLRDTGTAYWSPNTGATNSTGFTALPSAVRWNGTFSITWEAGFWTTTEYATGAADIYTILSSGVGEDMGTEINGYSVRCVRDY